MRKWTFPIEKLKSMSPIFNRIVKALLVEITETQEVDADAIKVYHIDIAVFSICSDGPEQQWNKW